MDRYEEALERAKAGKPIDEVFPELKESEDERIREEMIDYFYGCIHRNKKTGFRVEQIKSWIAYLEKHKDQNGSLRVIKDASEWEKIKEQKPVEWSEEDEKMLKCCLIAINHYEKTCNIGDHLPTKFNIGGYLASVDKVKSWLKSLRPVKQEWSEEDETRLTNIIIMLKEYVIHHYSKDDVNKSVNWLENRVKFLRPQPKQEWSEEDFELIVGELIQDVVANEKDAANYGDSKKPTSFFVKKYIDRFKSLRSRPKSSDNWKPSEEQMKALGSAIVFHKTDPFVEMWQSLYDDLQKLM